MNLFFIGTPLQLLNAVEARHYFELSNNHLVIALDLHTWPKTSVFAHLVRPSEWESVQYITLYNTTLKNPPRFMGKYLSTKFENCFYKYNQYINISRLHKIARPFSMVDSLVLGNYHQDQSRHFPHLIKYNNLYMVDDGTDVLYISEERRKQIPAVNGVPPVATSPSPWNRLRLHINESLKWNQQQAEKITFFTAYNIAVRNGDQAIKNEYHHMRKQIVPAMRRGAVFFLGQCLVRDGYLGLDQYLHYLDRVKSHFKDEEIVYVPHPRESQELVDRVHQSLGFTIKRFILPIEWQFTQETVRPAVIASFFCSALVTCAAIFREEFKLKAFYLQPEHVQKWPEFVERTYNYFSTQMAPFVEVVRL
jgi:hypothetical protein